MSHQIKINRAIRKSEVGRYPRSAQAMLDHINREVIATVTSDQLASILDSLWRCAEVSKAIGYAEATE